MLEEVLELLFSSQIISKFRLLFDFRLDRISHVIRFTHLQLCFIIAELFLDAALDALDAPIHERFKIIIVQVVGLFVERLVSLPLKTIVFFQVEDLFHVEHDLDEPVFAELPGAKLSFQVQTARVLIYKRVEDLALEHTRWYGLGVIRRDRQAEPQYSVLVDALFAEIEALPVGELWAGVVRQWLSWYEEHTDRCVLLQHLVLELECLEADRGHDATLVR